MTDLTPPEASKPVDLDELERVTEMQSRHMSGQFVVYVQHQTVLSLLAELRTLREAQRWIPVEERMPPTYQVISFLADSVVESGILDDRGQWLNSPTTEVRDVTHWFPLPALPDAPKGER